MFAAHSGFASLCLGLPFVGTSQKIKILQIFFSDEFISENYLLA